MNEALLFEGHTLATWDVTRDAAEIARVAATLFLFDRVVIPDHASLPKLQPQLRSRIMRAVRTTNTQDAVRLEFPPFSDEFSMEELMAAGLVTAELHRRAFRTLWSPLLKAGVVRLFHKDTAIDFDTVCTGYTATASDWMNRAYEFLEESDESPLLIFPPNASRGAYAAYHAFVGYVERLGIPEQAARWVAAGSRDPDQQFDGFTQATLLEFFQESYAAEKRGLPVIYRHELHFKLREMMIEGVDTWYLREQRRPWRRKRSAHPPLASRLLENIFLEIPAIIPRSPADLLEVRRLLHDELLAFREELSFVSRSLEKAGKDSAKDLAVAAREQFVKPLRDLTRKLAKPSHRLGRNLASSPGLAGASIALAAGVGATGRYGALLAALGAALSAGIATLAQEADAIESSNVAFLLKVQRMGDAASSG